MTVSGPTRLTDSTAGPPHQSGPQLGDPATVHVGVGLVMLGCQTGPARQLRRVPEPGHLTDLDEEHPQPGSGHPGQLPQRAIAGIGDQPPSGQPGEQVDLLVQVLDQAAQRLHRAAYGLGNTTRSSSSLPPRPNRSDTPTWMPRLASTACTSALQCDRSPTSFARCRTNSRSSRVAGGAIHASGSRPSRNRSARSAVSRKSLLTPQILERLHPQRMGQEDPRPHRLQGVHRPVPAVGWSALLTGNALSIPPLSPASMR